MNVPLGWLKDYVKLPKSEKDLTDRLTMVGHMLDKRKELEGDVVIDLELRGNRADMFGLIGVARDMSAIFETPLVMPPVAKLPKTDPTSSLIKAEASVKNLVKRYIAIKLEVKVGPSPDWLQKRLKTYGIDPINNVVDITNYVMVETSHPMHAFDYDKLEGGKLILRMAKAGETFETIQQGTTLTLTREDIAIADKKGVQCITCIGGSHTKVTQDTTTIILETAVYDAASARRTARRHKVMTESGNRHEKHQDPAELSFVLARAVKLLEEVATGKIVGTVSDYYPNPIKPTTISFNPSTLTRLVGISLPVKKMTTILTSLECVVNTSTSSTLTVVIPTFRTDIKQEADIVEEVIRIYGYEKIPVETLSGELPKVGTPPHVLFAQQLRSVLQTLQMNEVITSTLIAKKTVETYEQHGNFTPTITLVNAPDPDCATLRPSLLPNLVEYAKRSLGFRQKRIAFYEIGNVYSLPAKKTYKERRTLSLIMGGENPASWEKEARDITFFDLKGVIEAMAEEMGIIIRATVDNTHPSLGMPQAQLIASDMIVGSIGVLDPTIASTMGVKTTLYCAELFVDELMGATNPNAQPYTIAPLYPPILEDISFVVTGDIAVGELITALKGTDPLIRNITLVDVYENTRTIHVVYQDPTKNLTGDDVIPIRKKILDTALTQFGATPKSA
jgi:phenylalanyl-tRNA synthetase beta chain